MHAYVGNTPETRLADTAGALERWYFFELPGQTNEATSYYVGTIERAGRQAGVSLQRVSRLCAIPPRGRVLAIDCKVATRILLARPDCRCWLWVQGILPEEVELLFDSKLRKAIATFRERFAIPRAKGLIFVSRTMHDHYISKYGMRHLNPFIMPCINQKLDASTFQIPNKYEQPSFVYAGGMQKWQCFDVTLEVFQRVQASLPNATLSVLSIEEDSARATVERLGVRNVTVRRVPLEHLQTALRAHKYGFVLRHEHVVNAVATPTKTSSYMAAGVIPITTGAVRDFAVKLRPLQNVIMGDSRDPGGIAEAIVAFERRRLNPAALAAEYAQLFDEYFDHDAYVPRLARYLSDTGLSGANRGSDAMRIAGGR